MIAGTDPSYDPADATQIAYSNGGQIYTCTVTSCSGRDSDRERDAAGVVS